LLFAGLQAFRFVRQGLILKSIRTLAATFVLCVFSSSAFAQFIPTPSHPWSPGYDAYFGGRFGSPSAFIDPRLPLYGYAQPRSVLVHSEVTPAEPLPPARIQLVHRRNETLRVEVYDRKKRQTVFSGNIAPGQSVDLSLHRDSGGFVTETYRTYGVFGEVSQRTLTRAIPVDVRYGIVVHQWQVQSIAIDRTGKSPSPIEDIQYQGKGLGRFDLPPGPQLNDGQIDVYRNAVAAGNQGLVAPAMPPTDNDGPTSDPLRQAIDELYQR